MPLSTTRDVSCSTSLPFSQRLRRRTGDTRLDHIIKAEIYDAHIERHSTVIGVVDDRRSVVEMWRSRGLTCVHVAEGDF
ncbi:phosphatase domain-containing protein [Microbacterium sp. NPDC055665]